MAIRVKPPVETEEQKKNREMIASIAENISTLAQSVRSLLNGKLQRKTILVLLAHTTKFNQGEVDKVLTALEEMDKDWVKK